MGHPREFIGVLTTIAGNDRVGAQKGLVNYVAAQLTEGTYTADSGGKASQETTGYE